MTEKNVDARLLAMQGAQQIREGALAQEIRRGAEDLAAMRQQRDEYHKWWMEASTKLNKMIARQGEIKPLVILELQSNDDVEALERGLEYWPNDLRVATLTFDNVRFVGVLRPGRVEDE